jgi:hypothetical protein
VLKELSETAKPCRDSGGLALRRNTLGDKYLHLAIERDRQFPRATPPLPPAVRMVANPLGRSTCRALSIKSCIEPVWGGTP